MNNYFRTQLKGLNKDKKALIENFMSLSILQLLNIFLPLVSLPYVLRVFGVELYGITVMAASLVAYFHPITDFSFNITATRDVAVNRNNRDELSNIYSKVLSVKLFFIIISTLIFLPIIWLTPQFYLHKEIFYCTFPMLIGYALTPEWFFQGIENMKAFTAMNACIKVFFTISIFIIIFTKEDLIYYPVLNTLGYLGAGVYSQYLLISKYKLKFKPLGLSDIAITIKQNYTIFLNQFLPNLYNNSTLFLLGIFTNNSAVGIYAAIKRVIDTGVTITSVFTRIFFPYLNRNSHHFIKYAKLSITLSFIIGIFYVGFSHVILVYLNLSNDHIYIIMILALGLVFYGFYDCFGTNYFLVNREDKLVMKNTMLASIVGFIFAFPLIYWGSITGAAINLTIARSIMGLRLFYLYKKKNINSPKSHYKK